MLSLKFSGCFSGVRVPGQFLMENDDFRGVVSFWHAACLTDQR
jgi:hypothetical protein